MYVYRVILELKFKRHCNKEYQIRNNGLSSSGRNDIFHHEKIIILANIYSYGCACRMLVAIFSEVFLRITFEITWTINTHSVLSLVIYLHLSIPIATEKKITFSYFPQLQIL